MKSLSSRGGAVFPKRGGVITPRLLGFEPEAHGVSAGQDLSRLSQPRQPGRAERARLWMGCQALPPGPAFIR